MNRVLFLYWGRRGMSQFVHELAQAACERKDLFWQLSLSSTNEERERFACFQNHLLPVHTFERGAEALLKAGRIRKLQQTLRETIETNKIEAVITLMPHVWSPFIIRTVQKAGARYLTLLHDASRHPGDRTGLIHRLLWEDAARADQVITLSRHVAQEAKEKGLKTPLTTLFHPRLAFTDPAPLPYAEPLRLLSLGRIMAYKGLPLLVEALERLQGQGTKFHFTLMGEGDLGPLRSRLEALKTKILNRWLSSSEIAEALRSHHAVVLSHIEASQSGVAASALGAGVPVIAFATGGLSEQIEDGVTGLLADKPDAQNLAQAILRLSEPGRHGKLVQNIAQSQDKQSMKAFLNQILAPLPQAG